MDSTTNNESLSGFETLDRKTERLWMQMSSKTINGNLRNESLVNEELLNASSLDLQSPVAPLFKFWLADNLARAGNYAQAIKAYDVTVETSMNAAKFLKGVDVVEGALYHKAYAAKLSADFKLSIDTFKELAAFSNNQTEALFQAGIVAELTGDNRLAFDLYRSIATSEASSKTNDPAQLARRSLMRLDNAASFFAPNAKVLADLLTTALSNKDIAQLDNMLSRSHFSVGPMGAHTTFEDETIIEQFFSDLAESSVSARLPLFGSGGKMYLLTTGWQGRYFKKDVVFLLNQFPGGWQWTGFGILYPNEQLLDKLRPSNFEASSTLVHFTLMAPWPSGMSFRAGGLDKWILDEIFYSAGGLICGVRQIISSATSPCGYGPGGLYYNQWPTHLDEDRYAIDFGRYERGVPYLPAAGGTEVLATFKGVVRRVRAGISSGDSSSENYVDINHRDPNNPTDTDRFRSRYLHLAGPFKIPVSEGMFVITGQPLGLIDDTGNSLLNHLHFSLHDREIPHPDVDYGRSIKPTPLNRVTLDSGDSGTCVESTNVKRFPGLDFLPDVISFGSVTIGDSAIRQLLAENSSGESIQVSIQAPPPGSVFEWDAFDDVIAGREQRFNVTFRPRTNRIEQSQITIIANTPRSPYIIGLLGKGLGGIGDPDPDPLPETLDFSPDPINFGSVQRGDSRQLRLRIGNRTGRTIEISIPLPPFGSVFQWEALNTTIRTGGEININVIFRPRTNLLVRGRLTVDSSALGSPNLIGLLGKGLGGF